MRGEEREMRNEGRTVSDTQISEGNEVGSPNVRHWIRSILV